MLERPGPSSLCKWAATPDYLSEAFLITLYPPLLKALPKSLQLWPKFLLNCLHWGG